jgi:hypothetical protein
MSSGGEKLGGGPYNGYVPRQTITSMKSSDHSTTRRVLRASWNGEGALGRSKGYDRVITPFRAVMNMGDFLSRKNYVCGGPNPSMPVNTVRSRGNMGHIMSACDGTLVEGASCNPKFVADGSDYTRFKREMAQNKNYNDLGYGGYNNGSYEALMHVRGHH